MPDVIAIPGRNGWLFLDGDTNSLIKQLTGELRISERSLAAWEAELVARAGFLRDLSIPSLLLIAPNKESIYTEFLPDGVEPSARCTVDELADVLQRLNFPYIFPLAELRQSRRALEPYSPIDTHWNDYGALVAANLTLIRYGIPPIGLWECSFYVETWQGDLGSKCNPIETGPFLKGELRSGNKGQLIYDNRIVHGGHVTVYVNESVSDKRTLLAFGDSFCERVAYWLAERFYKVSFVHTTAFDLSLIREERPNFVLWEYAERFLISPPAPASGFSLEHLIRGKLTGLSDIELEKAKSDLDKRQFMSSDEDAAFASRYLTALSGMVAERYEATKDERGVEPDIQGIQERVLPT